MSLSFGSQSQKSSSSSKQQPWAPTIPYLQDYLGQIGGLAGGGLTSPTADQSTAASEIKNIYNEGNPYAAQIGSVASDMLAGPTSQSGMVTDAYSKLQEQLTPYASGQYTDFNSNPYLQQMLSEVGDDVQSRINAQFAGAGRDLSGLNQNAVAKGVTSAQLPILMQHLNQQQQNQLGAANTLFNAGNTAATTAQGLDTSALATRGQGIAAADAANNANLWGPQGIFNLEQTMQELPFQNLGLLGNLLLPVAQLGQQSSSTGKQSGTSFGVGAKLLSDERMKENIEEIGSLADGTPLVRFNYKGDPTVRIGILAQDVEEYSPEAVSQYAAPQAGTDDGTVKYVDMDLATRRSADIAGGATPSLVGEDEYSPAMPAPMPRPMLDEEPWMQREAA